MRGHYVHITTAGTSLESWSRRFQKDRNDVLVDIAPALIHLRGLRVRERCANPVLAIAS
jgi:hypothetical protein